MSNENPLIKAVDYLHEKRWIKGRIARRRNDEVVGVCAIGAIRYANFGNARRKHPAEDYVKRVLIRKYSKDKRQLLLSVAGIPFWNDSVVSNVDEVIHIFKEAAEDWDLDHVDQAND